MPYLLQVWGAPSPQKDLVWMNGSLSLPLSDLPHFLISSPPCIFSLSPPHPEASPLCKVMRLSIHAWLTLPVEYTYTHTHTHIYPSFDGLWKVTRAQVDPAEGPGGAEVVLWVIFFPPVKYIFENIVLVVKCCLQTSASFFKSKKTPQETIFQGRFKYKYFQLFVANMLC